MPPVGVHHTDASTASWDGNANKTALRLGESESYYRLACAWQDPDRDATTKEAWRFIHHEVSGSGEPGAANLTGCSTGIGVLNGGMGGTTIPEADQAGVWRHLAAHLTDGGQQPPELKAARSYTQRSFALTEVRLSDAGARAPVIEGYAAVFDQPATIGGLWFSYHETIAPGAFAKTIQEADIRALFNHNPDWVLGRNRAGTLTLQEDDHGLRVVIQPPDTGFARDLMESMRRGDINQMSFGFRVIKEQWAFSKNTAELDERRLLEVRLRDVSPVTFPSYPQTEAFVRSAIHTLQRFFVPEPGRMAHSAEPRAEPRREPPIPRHSLATDGSRPEALPKPETVRTDEPARQLSHSTRVDWGRLDRLESTIAKEART